MCVIYEMFVLCEEPPAKRVMSLMHWFYELWWLCYYAKFYTTCTLRACKLCVTQHDSIREKNLKLFNFHNYNDILNQPNEMHHNHISIYQCGQFIFDCVVCQWVCQSLWYYRWGCLKLNGFWTSANRWRHQMMCLQIVQESSAGHTQVLKKMS